MNLLFTGVGNLEKKTKGAAAFDLCADKHTLVISKGSAVVTTGINVAIPMGYFGMVTMRSGHGFNEDLVCHVGIIDSDYRGEVKVKVFNLGYSDYMIRGGERFAQLTLVPLSGFVAFKVDELEETERGAKGFGSTGV